VTPASAAERARMDRVAVIVPELEGIASDVETL